MKIHKYSCLVWELKLDNIVLFVEYLQDRIVLIKNALSNKRNEIKLLQKDPNNVGGQSLLNKYNINKTYSRSEMASNKYLVETILMDDLIDYIRLNKYMLNDMKEQ